MFSISTQLKAGPLSLLEAAEKVVSTLHGTLKKTGIAAAESKRPPELPQLSSRIPLYWERLDGMTVASMVTEI